MWRVFVRSRGWNVALGVLGAVYALAATGVLSRLVFEVWNAAAMLDFVMQAALLASAACGVWFVVIALENLGIHIGHHGHRTPHKAHK